MYLLGNARANVTEMDLAFAIDGLGFWCDFSSEHSQERVALDSTMQTRGRSVGFAYSSRHEFPEKE